MKKAMLRITAALFAALIILASFGGCGDTVETVVGGWESADGSSMVISEKTLSITDGDKNLLLPEKEAAYEWRSDCFYIELGGVMVKVFNVDLTGDTLTLTYTEEIQADMGISYDGKIIMTRVTKD